MIMRAICLNLIIAALMMWGCTDGVTDEDYQVIELNVGKLFYAPEDTVSVRLNNYTYSPIFLDGCSQFWLATKTDTGWVETPLTICESEEMLMKIRSGGTFGQKYPAEHWVGRHRIVAQIATGCLEGKPRREAQCRSTYRIESNEFMVIDPGNVAQPE
jgi:hypothetical protein